MSMKDKLFKFGSDAKAAAEKVAKGAVDGSKKVAEKVKINNAIAKAESRINALYVEIGQKYEELYAENPEADFAEMLSQIAEAKEEIAQAKADLAAVDSAVICESCGKYVQEGQRFCPHCGAKQPEPVVEAEAEEVEAEAAEEAAVEDAPAEDAPEEVTED